MKRIMNFVGAIAILSMVFVFLASTGNVYLAGSVTVGIGAFSAIMYTSQHFKGAAFDLIVIPDFTAKTDEEIEEMEFKDLVEYRKAEKEFEFATMRKEFHDKIEELKTKEDDPDKDEKITKLEETIETMKEEHIEWGLKMKKMTETPSYLKTLENKVHEWIETNKDEIVKIHSQKSGLIEFKAVADITTASASLPSAAPAIVGVQDAPPAVVNFRGTIIEPLVTTFPTTLAAYPYTETTPKDGDYTFIAEGTSKAQIDFKIETRWAEPVKIAAHEILTDESVQDIPNLQMIATDFLRKKHDIKKENGILFGDGIAPNPKGATVYGRAFVAGDMAGVITAPNFMDIANACITDIFTTHNYQDETPYMANLVMINPIVFFTDLVAAKDLNGLPLYPTASLFNRVTIGGVTIIPFEDIPAAKIFVADMSKYNITNYVSYTVQIGWINDQLITNKFTMVGESRFHAFVKELDEQAFIYDDIATIETAITAT